MIKSIYISPLNSSGIENSCANHLIVSESGLDIKNWQKLQGLGVRLSVAVNALEKGEDVCVLDLQVQKRLLERLDNVLQFQPEEIWIDRFRFGGDCTDISEEDVKKTHKECQFCEGKNRTESITEFGEQLIQYINGRSKLGLFAVAFKDIEAPGLAQALGIDYSRLGRVFDLFSPMLYHRMMGKPVSYISDYTKWLAEKTGKPVLPIIQIKDMPDDLEDKMSEEDITEAFNEAIKDPSSGVCFFWWAHALEKGKTGVVAKLLSGC